MDSKMLILAGVVMIFGCVLIGAALCIPPPGIIDNSVLFAFGEISTFSATILGMLRGKTKSEKNQQQTKR